MGLSLLVGCGEVENNNANNNVDNSGDVGVVDPPPVVVTGENFAPSDYYDSVIVPDGASKEFGESVQYVNGKTYKGLKLTGSQGATFNLGNIDISKSSWDGDCKSITGKHNSFIDYVYQPSSNSVEISSLLITLTDVTNSEKNIKIYVNKGKKDVIYVVAKANNQQKLGSFIADQGFFEYDSEAASPIAAYKSVVLSSTAKALGLEEKDCNVNFKGNSDYPVSLVYDKEDNTLYSPMTDASSDNIKKSFAIRSFKDSYPEKYYVDQEWSGFASNIVNVKLQFVKAKNVSSVVVTKIGSYDLTGTEVFVADNDYIESVSLKNPQGAVVNEEITLYSPEMYTVIHQKPMLNSKVNISGNGINKTLTFDSQTKTYTFTKKGTYTLTYYKEDGTTVLGTSKIVVAAAKLSTDTLNVKTDSSASKVEYGTYKQVVSETEFTGIKLTGGSNAAFNLGKIDLNKSNWNGTYDVLKAFSESFLEFVFLPSTNKNEISSVTFKLSQGSKYIEFKVKHEHYEPYSNEFLITAKANNQTSYRCYRKGQPDMNRTVRKGLLKKEDANILYGKNKSLKMGMEGDTEVPVAFFYSDGGLYSSSTYINTQDDLNNSMLIRKFTSENMNDNDGELWGGFETVGGKTEVDLTVTFDGMANGATKTSIVITKLGDNDLGLGVVDINEKDFTIETPNVKSSVTVGERVYVYAPIKSHVLYRGYIRGSYVEVYFGGSKVDTITFTSLAYEYTFNNIGEYTLMYYDGSGELIKTSIVTARGTT